MYADLGELTPAESQELTAAGARLGFDVQPLSPRMGLGPEVTVLASTTLAALLANLAAQFGADSGNRLLALIRLLRHGRTGKKALEDRGKRIIVVWDEQAEKDGQVAAAALVRIGDAIAMMPDGTTLVWDHDAVSWGADRTAGS